jgi:hypothetical protein
MAKNLLSRIAAMERTTGIRFPEVFRIICRGATPTREEQAQIDEAEERGMYVICRLIVTTRNNALCARA